MKRLPQDYSEMSAARSDGWWNPENFTEMADALSRRRFLKLAGASLALAGLAGCRRPVEKIVPYLSSPEEVILGVPNYYATSMSVGMEMYGLLVESHEGRPTKIEGHPLHPSTLGGSTVLMQAAILELYDPDRSREVLHNGVLSSWVEFVEYWRRQEATWLASHGEGLAILSESFASPTLFRWREQFQRRFPKAFWATYEPISDENVFAGVRAITGAERRPHLHLDQAEVILALDHNFLHLEGDGVAQARQFADRRRVRQHNDEMNRLYVIESVFSLTGAMADHRLAIPSWGILPFTLALAAELQRQGLPLREIEFATQSAEPGWNPHWIQVVSEDLLRHSRRSLILAGRRQPAVVHAVVLALNAALGNIGRTVTYHEMKDTVRSDQRSLAELTGRMNAGRIGSLFIVGGNPVYHSPADLNFAGALAKVTESVHLNLYQCETSRAVTWHLPQAHFLENWGDARYTDGTLSVVQPLIQPLFGGKSAIELLQLLATGQDRSGYDLVRETWQDQFLKGQGEDGWLRVLHDGFLKESIAPGSAPEINLSKLAGLLNDLPMVSDKSGLEIVFLPDAKVWDGRFANNAWLQELPDPITKITWDNAVSIPPKMARDLKIQTGDVVRLGLGAQKIEAPVWVQPGQAEGTAVVTLGYGREAAGSVGSHVGFNAYRLRTLSSPDFTQGLVIIPLGARYKFAFTQEERSLHQRPLIRRTTWAHLREHPDFIHEMIVTPPMGSLWKEHQYQQGHQWGMVIDLSLCTGCSACVMACQSENNIPVVGKRQVAKSREMHWLRVDSYFIEAEGTEMAFQPIPCQQCEMAPCEQVCPVAATVHDPEGLNLMTYNRCVGTRYCSNNCPYKVRRFNFFNYTKNYPELAKMRQNPEVTVRSRGVMEKCTYCLQRINRAKYQTKQEDRPVRDGEILTACQQACPTSAITFGDINDSQSRVAALKQLDQNYAILAEYNTRPRTTYLARLKNPNPRLQG